MAPEETPEAIALVLDTSVFTNPATSAQFGPDVATAVECFVALARRARPHLRCYMPPSIFEELKTFLVPERIPADFEIIVALRAPNRYGVLVPSHLLYELIEDVRMRIDRGLRVAEKAVRSTVQTDVDRTINRLRNEYREALRAGLVDSREDVDLILLARELDAALVSSDGGVTNWAERLGIRLIAPDQLRRLLESLVQSEPSPR